MKKITPGSNLALINEILNVIITENLYINKYIND